MRAAMCLHHGNHDTQRYRKCMCTGTMKLWALELGKQNMAATLCHCMHYRTFNRGGEGMMAGAVGAMEAGAASHLVDQRALGTSNGHRLQDTFPADLCQTCLLPQKLHNLPKQGNPLGNQIFKLMGLLGTFYIQTVTLHLYRRRNQQWAAWPFKNLCLVTKLSHCLATSPPF